MNSAFPTVAILGASGLIGEAAARHLARAGFPIIPIARGFSPAQRAAFGSAALECSFASSGDCVLDRIFVDNRIDIVLNCVGVLQDGHRGSTEDAHHAFVARLVALLESGGQPTLLIHISIPGRGEDDRTPFSRTKRKAEDVIAAGSGPFIILRQGFVVAQAAYGGSALIRALAILPLNLPAHEAERPFATIDVADIVRTVAHVALRWREGEQGWNTVWDVMACEPSTVDDVIGAFRHCLGGPKRRMPLPFWLLRFGASAGDLVAYLGWSPPLRTTALQEMRRGVAGNPEPWIAATGIQPVLLRSTVQSLPSTVQERWFARLYLCKPLVLASLMIFWTVSGLIALTVAFGAATTILTSHGLPVLLSKMITGASSLVDISIGLAIAVRRTCYIGLLAGIGVSLFYMIGAAIATPELWIEPLGALEKTGPAIVLMVVALGMLEDR